MATSKAVTIVLIAAMFALAWGQVPAPEPAASAFEPSAAAAPGSDCQTKLFTLADCLSYVQNGSNATKPEKACCQELAGLVESSPVCLCYLLDKNRTESAGFNIDTSRALKLPSVCGVKTPPVSACSAILGVPVGSPTGSEGSPGSASPTSLPANKAWNHGVSVSALASLIALVIAFQFPIFPSFGL
ncbi:hypothetical protein SLA2020_220360 [Shorea laevis]